MKSTYDWLFNANTGNISGPLASLTEAREQMPDEIQAIWNRYYQFTLCAEGGDSFEFEVKGYPMDWKIVQGEVIVQLLDGERAYWVSLKTLQREHGQI